MHLLLVAGARPNFMKVAPIVRELQARGHRAWTLVHTGQHYDERMSNVFFTELGLPEPHRWLGVGSGSQACQTARIMTAFEEVCVETAPDRVVVVGDVNSTMAATLVAAKLSIPVAHVEAGLRSGDRTMPEEVNRLVTDVLADLLLAPSEDAVGNLIREGVDTAKILMVGNVMVDTLLAHVDEASRRDILRRLHLTTPSGRAVEFAVLTLHRPSNVDNGAAFEEIVRAVSHVAQRMPVVFPAHPRTAARAAAISHPGIKVIEPLGYLDFLGLTQAATLVLTDSGGLQEEATVLGVPCVTLRETTERPVTVTHGTNVLAGTSYEGIVTAVEEAIARPRPTEQPPMWDGKAASRIVDALLRSRP